MGILGPRQTKDRPGYTGRSFMSKATKFGIVASGWPPERGRITNVWSLSILKRMNVVQKWMSRINDREVDPLRQALIRHNNSHEGLRGTASIRLEDLLQQHGFGRLFAYVMPDGKTRYHRDAILDVSLRLDWFEPRVGSMLTRTPNGWLPTIACEPGAKLKVMPSIPIDGCCPVAQVTPNVV